MPGLKKKLTTNPSRVVAMPMKNQSGGRLSSFRLMIIYIIMVARTAIGVMVVDMPKIKPSGSIMRARVLGLKLKSLRLKSLIRLRYGRTKNKVIKTRGA